MEQHQEAQPFAGFVAVREWLEKQGGAFFPTRSSFDWFVKANRRELVEKNALIPGAGRRGSLVNSEELPKVVVAILKRRALQRAA